MGFLWTYFIYYILADTSRTILWLKLLVTDDLDLLIRGSVLKGSYVFPMLSVYLLGIPFFRILLSKKIVQRKALPWHSITLYLQNCLGLEFFNSNIAGEMAQLMMKNQQHYMCHWLMENQIRPKFWSRCSLMVMLLQKNAPEMLSECLKMVIPELTVLKALIQCTLTGIPRLNYMR